MENLTNTLQNNALAALSRTAPRAVSGAIKNASASTGVDFAYLLQQAKAESSFNPTAKAKTSSASGLFQFIESTWMGMVEKYGDKHGLNTDGKTRGEILDLRNDPRAASLMAAEFAGENERFLKTHVKDADIGATELYFAHFLGAGQAAAFLNAKAENGMQKAAYLFPKAAKANQNVFYERGTGRAKSLDEVYAFFDKKFELEGSIPSEPNARNSVVAKNSYSPTRIDQNSIFNARHNTKQRVTTSSLYQDLFASSLNNLLLAQMMETPLASSGRSSKEFNLFSTRSLFK